MNKASALLACLLSLITSLSAATPVLSASHGKTVLDGVINPQEWGKPLATGFYADRNKGLPDPRFCALHAAYDDQFLYLAIRSELPPEQRLVDAQDIIIDDTVEFWFAPPEGKRTVEEYRFGYFQIMVDGSGNSLAQHFEPGYGLATRPWNSHARIANSLHDGFWDCEVAIPWKSLGMTKPLKSGMGFMCARNFNKSPVRQCSLTRIGVFSDRTAYATLLLDAKPEQLVPRHHGSMPPNQPKWTHLGSHLTFFQDFRNLWNTPVFSLADKKAMTCKEQPQTVDNHTGHGKAIHLAKEELILPPGLITMPGNISCWVKADNLKRKYMVWGTEFRGSGYFGLHQSEQTLSFFKHHFPNDTNKNVGITIRQNPNQWQHISVNFHPTKIEFYTDGLLRDTIQTNAPFDPAKLGGLRFGPRQSVSDISIYDRPLNPAEILSLAHEAQSFNGRLSYFPSLSSIVAEFHYDIPPQRKEGLTLEVSDKKGFKQTLTITPQQGTPAGTKGNLKQFHVVLPVKLPEGTLRMTLMDPLSDRVLTEREFIVKHYPWEHNSLGQNNRIVKPYTPIQVQGRKLSVLLRDYTLAANGLPQSILAPEQEILARPTTLTVERNGKGEAWQNETMKILKAEPHAVSYEANAENNLVDLDLQGRLEYDGLFRLDLTLTPKAKAMPDTVRLDMTLKPEYAKLFHASGAATRNNPAGFLPQGKGIIWRSTQLQNHNFIPYCWIGDDTKGICYAADTDFGWVLGRHDAVEIIRNHDNTVTLRLNIVSAQPKSAKVLKVTLALMATPVRPQPQGFRGWADQATWRQKGTRHMISLLSPPYWGAYYSWISRYPADGTMTYFHELDKVRCTGKLNDSFMKKWVKDVIRRGKLPEGWNNPKAISAHVLAAMVRMTELHRIGPDAFYYIYTANAESAKLLPEYPVYKDEWEYRSLAHVTASFADYSLYYINQMLEAGVGGIYMDNTFFCRKYCWPTGDGYLTETGDVRPSYGLWRSRDYIRRLAVLMEDRGMEPWITAHHTNANLLPVFTHVTNVMGMEWKYGTTDFQERFTPDYIRAVNQGKQGGFFPTSLDGLRGTPAHQAWLTRTMLAMLLPHEIRPTASLGTAPKTYRTISDILFDFGIHKTDCTPFLYWDPQNPVKPTHPGLLVTAYRRGNRLLLVVGDYNAPASVSLTCQLPIKAVRNLETGERVPCTANTIQFPYRRHDLKLLEVILEDK